MGREKKTLPFIALYSVYISLSILFPFNLLLVYYPERKKNHKWELFLLKANEIKWRPSVSPESEANNNVKLPYLQKYHYQTSYIYQDQMIMSLNLHSSDSSEPLQIKVT